MGLYKICEKNVCMYPRGDELSQRAAAFYIGEGVGEKADILIHTDEAECDALAARCGYSPAMAEYQLSCGDFCLKLLRYGGFVLHASAVVYGGECYLFSAPSGVGKSTHAKIWCRRYNARIINDDKPAITVSGKAILAHGTPWCGSGRVTLNESAPVKALYFLKRSQTNRAVRLDSARTVYLLLESMERPADDLSMDALFAALDAFVKAVPVFVLECNMEDGAAETALENMRRGGL